MNRTFFRRENDPRRGPQHRLCGAVSLVVAAAFATHRLHFAHAWLNCKNLQTRPSCQKPAAATSQRGRQSVQAVKGAVRKNRLLPTTTRRAQTSNASVYLCRHRPSPFGRTPCPLEPRQPTGCVPGFRSCTKHPKRLMLRSASRTLSTRTPASRCSTRTRSAVVPISSITSL